VTRSNRTISIAIRHVGFPQYPHTQLLIEITIIEFACIIDTNGITAHHIVNRIGIEITHQQIHVIFQFTTAFQKVSKALDGHVGNGKQLIEQDTKIVIELFLVLEF